jgi:CHASE2 domain-containing sensor protein
MQWPPTSVRQWDPFNLRWFYPMVDYTIPPNAIYQVVPASRVRSDLQQLGGSDRYRNRAVLIGSGHESAGVDAPGSDRLEIPLAVDFWRKARSSQNPRGTEFTGAELLAYQFQAYLNRRFVWPIPDLWMVGLAAFAGKTISLRTSRSKKSTITLLGMGAIAGVFYILACLQIYFATLVLVPILFPLVTMGAYFVMSLLERRRVRG